MKIVDIRALPDDEIQSELGKIRKRIFKMQCQAKGNDAESPALVKSLRKDIARMLTVLRERELSRA